MTAAVPGAARRPWPVTTRTATSPTSTWPSSAVGRPGLAAGYFLRRAKADFVILDAQSRPGGAWRHGWDSFGCSPQPSIAHCPAGGCPTSPASPFPTAGHVRDYLTAYEARYHLPCGATSTSTPSTPGPTTLRSAPAAGSGAPRRDQRDRDLAPTVLAPLPGSAHLPRHPDPHRVLPPARTRSPGSGSWSSAAATPPPRSWPRSPPSPTTTWVTPRPPRFLPDDVDGRVLFDVATQRTPRPREGRADTGGVAGLGDIVMVPPVKDARDRVS